jgi:hypothetical protein
MFHGVLALREFRSYSERESYASHTMFVSTHLLTTLVFVGVRWPKMRTTLSLTQSTMGRQWSGRFGVQALFRLFFYCLPYL